MSGLSDIPPREGLSVSARATFDWNPTTLLSSSDGNMQGASIGTKLGEVLPAMDEVLPVPASYKHMCDLLVVPLAVSSEEARKLFYDSTAGKQEQTLKFDNFKRYLQHEFSSLSSDDIEPLLLRTWPQSIANVNSGRAPRCICVPLHQQ